RTRIIFTLSQEVKHALSAQINPNRLILDLPNTELPSDLNLLAFSDPVVRKVYTNTLDNGVMRTIFELNEQAQSRAVLLQDKNGGHPYLVVEIKPQNSDTQANRMTDNGQQKSTNRKNKRNIVIVLDPGHGGIDPGAIGAGGVREKDVALAVAKRVAREINATPGYKAYLTRNDDRFVPLGRRRMIARVRQADLFISLHADAFHMASARGASVYCLAERGKAVPANQKSLMLGNTLLSSIASTPSLALHVKTIKQARFDVLKTEEIPSVLVEMAFLSNRQEEMLLRKTSHQISLSKAVSQGAKQFTRLTGLA
ncbi:MAG: N-acetylmuramoyl-L-alanine amidase, partial [Magnetococcales bacterium]|nr:N-acetylmuramoyl-L-alanine amidase [Magnetococcales bacterium]